MVALLAVILIILLLLPTIISSHFGTSTAIKFANSRLQAKMPGSSLGVVELELSWFGPQIARGVELRDAKGEILLLVPVMVFPDSLFELAADALFRS